MTADRLRELLGAEPPESVERLDEATLAELVEIIREARRRQGQSLVAAFEETFRHVPRPMRAIVRKVLLG